MEKQIDNNESCGNQATEVTYKRVKLNLLVLMMRIRMKMRIKIRMRIDGRKMNEGKDEVVVVVRGYKSE